MPSASPDLSAEWPDGDHQAIKHLQDAGYILTRKWQWKPPREPTDRDMSAIQYLIDEWDFDGLTTWT